MEGPLVLLQSFQDPQSFSKPYFSLCPAGRQTSLLVAHSATIYIVNSRDAQKQGPPRCLEGTPVVF